MSGAGPCRFAAVILAAGASSRMGCPKLLLPWGDSTVIRHVLGQWRSLTEQAAVVMAPDNADLLKELTHPELISVHRIINPEAQRGMFGSVQCAAAWPGWKPEITHIAIALGDQPQFDVATILGGLLEFARQHSGHVCQPSFRNAPKHPVIFPRDVFSTLAASNAATLKEVLGARPVSLWPLDDSRLNVDLDYPADYERAHALYSPMRIAQS